jgi:type I restriction enzyme S subunit
MPPTLAEQQAIVVHIKAECAPLDQAISRALKEIKLIREYRTRLVADVVTGKLDVREAAARLPEEALSDTAEEPIDDADDTELTGEEAET